MSVEINNVADSNITSGAATVHYRSRRDTFLRELKRAHLYALPVLWAVFNVFAVYWIVVSAFKSNREVFRDPWGLPDTLQFDNFIDVWQVANLSVQFRNSVIITAATVLFVLVLCAPAAYVLARTKMKWAGLMLVIFIAGAGVPAAMLIIPLFVIMKDLFLIDTLYGLIIIYTVVSVPFSMFVLTGFFKSIPTEFAEAARMDGCSEFGVFFKIMLPLASPGLLTISIFNFVAIWNEYALALVFIQDKARMPLSRGVYAIAGSMIYTGNWVGLFAAVVIIMIPSIIIYVLLSERMIEGITGGALK